MKESEETIYNKIEPRLYEMIALKIRPTEHVLDIGCGECKLVNTLAKKIGCKVVGIDIHDWGFAKGKPHTGEPRVDAARREVHEEIGIDNVFLVKDFREKEEYFFKKKGDIPPFTISNFIHSGFNIP